MFFVEKMYLILNYGADLVVECDFLVKSLRSSWFYLFM